MFYMNAKLTFNVVNQFNDIKVPIFDGFSQAQVDLDGAFKASDSSEWLGRCGVYNLTGKLIL